jgi:predicted nucleic acid-binding protein
MAKKTDAYVDTSALIAFVDVSDTHNPLFRRLFANPPRTVITTCLVVVEGHAWFLKRYDGTRALQFLAMIDDMQFLEVIDIGLRELAAGTAVLRKFSDQDLTLVDAVGLHVMKARQTRSCWSTDRHLGLTGVPLAIHG